MPDAEIERAELTVDIRQLLDKLKAKDKNHELLRWRQHFFSDSTVLALATAQTQFPDRFKKDGVETLNGALVEYMAEIEDAIAELDQTDSEAVADEDAQLELVC
jgi:hypothetical protein